ncbi:MAG: hypothetical protein WGN25_15360 [Candidatus Electrothrix sp. GW3-4]|uniref:hypothetical protein n=1 Tax=Candidatus Electrothrix sp. GW3-4 TaxID=3126740 RepID=UPI0030D43F7F
MDPKKRVWLLILIMFLLVISTTVVSVGLLYQTSIKEQKIRLAETAKSQARLIEAVANFNKSYSNNYSPGAREATLVQIREAHSNYQGFGVTGEFTLAEKKNKQIIFLLSHRHYDLDNPKPVPCDSPIAEPMRLALSGKSGVVIGLDYRGAKVLAAHEPVGVFGLGIVAKIDLAEIRAPFIKVINITAIFSFFLITLGVSIFLKLTNPLLRNLNNTIEKLQKVLREVKVLRGILPICSFCKKIRDDKGYWNQVEVYLRDRSDADFSHGICPECMRKHYPGFLQQDTHKTSDQDSVLSKWF